MSNIVSQLQHMENKTWQYGGHIHYIKKAAVVPGEDKIKIVTNLQEYTRPLDSATAFINQFTEIKQVAALVPTTHETVNQQILDHETEQANTLVQILMDNITKIKTDPAFLPQAKAINNNVNSIINVARVKLDMQRTFSKKR